MGQMGWLAWNVSGRAAGILTSMIAYARMGLIVVSIGGIAGAFIGSYILKLLGVQEILAFNWNTLLVATDGVVGLLFLPHLIRDNRLQTRTI